MDKIAVFNAGAKFRQMWIPKGIHTNTNLKSFIQSMDIEVLYSNQDEVDGYLKIQNNHIQMILTRYPKTTHKLYFYNYVMANLLSRLVLDTNWIEDYTINDAMLLADDCRNDNQHRKHHWWYQKKYSAYYRHEDVIRLFTLGFLMPADNWDTIDKTNLSMTLLSDEFGVEPCIIKQRQEIDKLKVV